MDESRTDALDESMLADFAAAVQLADGERLDRVFVFDRVERKDTAFTMFLVTKELADGRLEMVAIGERHEGSAEPDRDFVRRARFPADTLPTILEEFIDRCGIDGAVYREIELERVAH